MSSLALPRAEALLKPRVPQRFRMPAPDHRVRMAHSAVRGAVVELIRTGQYHDARELLLATVKSALRAWCLAVGYHEPARNTNAVFFARLLREVHQIDRATFRIVDALAHGPFDGNTAGKYLEAAREIHDAVYWTAEVGEGGAL